MKMADDHSGGIPLHAEVKSNDVHLDEEKVLPVSYNHQLTTEVIDPMTQDAEKNVDAQAPCLLQKTSTSVTNSPSSNAVDAESKELCEVSSAFGYDRMITNASAVKRTRGRPRKDCQRPVKHHLGQSVASKVFPGRPRFRGRKFQHFLMTHTPHKTLQDMASVLDVYEDIDSDLKPVSEIPEKMLLPSETIPDNELKIEKFCSLCNLSEKSLLGQGKLKHFKPSEGFHCFEVMGQRVKEKNLEVTTSDTGGELKLFFKKQKLLNSPGEPLKIHRSKSLQSFPEKTSLLTDLIQELELTGFKSVPESCDIFELSGELYAHFNCAAWSDGVTKTFEKLLSNVDKAVVSAAFQKCSKCARFGASVRCCVSDCTKIYHYPCAIVSGALQNANCFKIICSIHLEDAFSFGVICMACHESGDLSMLLLCTSCSNYYHGNCMDPPITPSPDVRAGWQCLDCKVCQNCRLPGDSSKMIICNTCDKGYHTFCVKPAVSSVPKSGWKCSACRMCGDCGARTPGNGPSSRWHLNYSVCDSCYQQRNKGIACPLCGKAYRQFSQRKGMKHCTVCQKYIHEDCDKRTRRNSMDYVCPICTASEGKHLDGSVVDLPIKDNYQSSSRDSFLSGNEESLSSESEDGSFDGVPAKISQRRTSSNELRHKKSSKPKYKAFSIPNFMYSMSAAVAQKEYKMDDDDPTEDNKLILASATDEFVLCQDLCVMCGSFGRGEEGRLISCAQCGQCYHSYCVSVKVTTVVLKKGWRCLDCTVCEGCGQPHDEGRLLLCDECDISFHIYCLDPPLQEVPQGNWKCKWCVNCVKCGSKSPGLNCDWQVNYTLCGPCASFAVCCLCQQRYEDTELVIQCSRCERWLHGLCDQIETEDHAEKCAEYGYTCPHCRSPDELPPHLLPPPRTPTPEIEPVPEKHASPIAKPKDPEPPVVKSKPPVQFFLDGVCLSESGLQYIKSLAPEQPKKIPRPRKIKQISDSVRAFSFLDRSNEDSTSAGATEETKMDAATLEELAMKAYDFEEGKLVVDSSKEEDKKKRPRKLQKLGIGGFSVKPRGRLSTGKDATVEPVEAIATPVPDPVPTTLSSEVSTLAADGPESNSLDKPKRKRKPKKKTHLDESFPVYLRDAFFGKDLLLSCKKMTKSEVVEVGVDAKTLSGDPLKGNPETNSSMDSKATIRLQEDTKDFLPTPGLTKSKESSAANIVYKSMIKSEIESIKEEHLSSTSMDTSAYPGSGTSKSSAPYSAASQGVGPSMHASVMPNLHHPDSNSSWPDSDCDQSQMQKNILKWESDEHLGLLSTISPVLYANINLPHLKIEFPAWADRVKQIAKIWRGLPPEKRQPYLQRARENRAASRTSQRSNSSESDKSQKEVRTPSDVDPEKQWKQFQAMRQLQHQAQQRLLQEQRVQAASKAEKPIGSPAVADMDKNLKLFHSKSMSEIPQFPSSSSLADEGLSKDGGRKVFEKRWSSSALDLNATQALIQGNKIKMELPSSGQPPFMKDNMQNNPLMSGRTSVVHSSRVLGGSPSMEPQLSIPDASVPPTGMIKSADHPFHVSPSHSQVLSQIQKPHMPMPVLTGKDEASRVSSLVQKDASMATPPATPRPHSSDSFFQLSPSPQSQLLASLDSHSQPTPARTPTTFEMTKSSPSVVQSAPNFSMGAKVGLQPPTSSPKPSLQPPVQQFVLQQGSLTPANIAKQLSQYKETFGSISSTQAAARTLMSPQQEKPIEQQNLEQFLKEGSPLTLPYPAKVNQHQQLRDLLQNKKVAEPVLDRSNEGNVHSQSSNQNLSLPGSIAMCSTSATATTAVPSTSHTTSSTFSNSQTSQASSDNRQQQVSIENRFNDSRQQQVSVDNNDSKQQSSADNRFNDSRQHQSSVDSRQQQPSVDNRFNDGRQQLSVDNRFIDNRQQQTSIDNRQQPVSIDNREQQVSIDSRQLQVSIDNRQQQASIDNRQQQASIDNRQQHSSVDNRQQASIDNRQQQASIDNRFNDSRQEEASEHQQITVERVPQSTLEKDLMLSNESEKRASISAVDDVCLPILSNKDDPKEEACPDLNKKRKTTAGDLVKDLETEPEEHDVIAANCSLYALSADVGELELDDDELLGLGNDFNILEYADPELDKSLVGEGDKNNILDEHLDLDDKDEELEEDVIKDAGQEKDLIAQEMSDKKEMEITNEKCKETDKGSELSENFLDFDKKDIEGGFESSFQPKGLDSDNPPLEPLNTVKEEPKQAFSSCSLTSQTYSPSINIKMEKTTAENCPKSHPMSFVNEPQGINSPRIQCPPDAVVPPPSYRMVTALKQTLASHQGPLMQQQSKGMFPLHLNMNIRQELSLSQQGVNMVDNKPLLLQEQPLLLAELVEQEKREQRRHTQEGLISPHGDALLSDIDFERLKDDVFSGPPDDSLGGPGSLLGPHEPTLPGSVSPSVGVPSSPSSHNFGPPPYSLLWQNQDSPGALAPRPVTSGFMQTVKKAPPVSAVISQLGLPNSGLVQKAPNIPPGSLPARPFNPHLVPSSPPIMDPEKLKLLNYEKQLLQQQALLSSQQKYVEAEVIKLRKVKKALNAKQRQLRKNGAELAENDSIELARVSQEQAGLQKQLDQVRKQTRQNTIAIQDFRLKQQKRQQQQQPPPPPQPQQVPRSPMQHPAVNSVQSSPQNSQSPLQFTHAAPPSPMMPASPSVRLHSPSHLMQSVGSNLQSPLFSQQLQMPKQESANWPSPLKMPPQGDLQVADRFLKREQFDRNVSQTFSLSGSTQSPQTDITLKSLMDIKKNLGEETFKPSPSNASLIPGENADQQQQGFSAKSADTVQTPNLLKEPKVEAVSTAPSTVSQSILSQSLPSSVSNTLKFTLRQTGMPTGCLPTDATTENPNEVKPDVKVEPNCEKSTPSETSVVGELLTHIKQEIMDDMPVENANNASSQMMAEMGGKNILQESSQKQKEDGNEGSTDEELEGLVSKTSSTEPGGEQNVLLKQLLQNCPSAETRKTADDFIGLRKEGEESSKLELPFNVDDLAKARMEDPKSKKPTYLDIRRAQLDKEPTPPPGEKPKAIKRKRPKKKKLEPPEGGVLAKKKCRRSSSKMEEGYETYVETLMNKLTSLPPLRILEPNIKPNHAAVPVFGAGDLNVKENQLKGHYGSATVPDQIDIYSFHPYTKNQPPTSTILPPSSPPYRGFYNQEFPAIARAFEKNEMSLALKPPMDLDHSKVSRDAGSPDTVVSSSSPESCLFEPLCKWPKLIFVDKVMPESKRNGSPVIPLMYPVPLRFFPKEWGDLDEDKDKENIPDDKMEMGLTKTKMSGIGGYSAPLKDSGNVAVTLTLSSAAAEDICGVLSALADLLKIPIPASYEIVERTATPPSQKLGLYRRSKNSEVSIHSLLNGKPRFCRHCDIVVLSAGIRKKASDLPCISKEEQEEEDEVIFCSTNCYMQFALTHRSTVILEEKEAAAVVDHIGESVDSKYLMGEDSLGALVMDEKEELEEGVLKHSQDMEVDPSGENVLDALGDDKYLTSSNPYDIDLLNDKMEICDEEPVMRKWKSIKYKYWNSEGEPMAKPKRKEDSNEKVVRPFYHTIKPSQMPKDERKCIFCHSTGDGDTSGAARLLNMDVNKWVHLNCALWSYEVYETVNGALMNVEVAFKRSRHLSCYSCHKQGASVRCFKTRCPNVYHFPCAKREQCAFFKDKTVMCPQHVHKGNPENRLDSTAVFRRVYINREEHKQVASMIQDEKYVMRVGSLIFLNIGQLLPTQIQAFHNTNCIYPVGYKVIRMYWSMRKLGRRSQYICTINEVSGKPEFTIQVKELDQKDVILKDKTAKGVWQKVLYPIEKMRKQAKTIKIFPDFITGDDLFGLAEPAVLRIVESLPGVDTLYDYNFRYGRSPFLELPLAINPTGCARSEPKLRTHFKRSHTLHTSNTTRSFLHSAFAGFYPEVSSTSSPYIKQFVHSKSSQYRKMKTEWRNNVYLARSRIQGLGLYATRDMEKHTMVIEYIGQLIRNEIAERNEAIYDAQNRGTYMFRLDENRVIDATMSGGLARYINHSCNPNCTTEAVQIDRENKIIIITNRRVTRGEELSYDYKFEVEDDQHKIPCLCGAPNCRKWMN